MTSRPRPSLIRQRDFALVWSAGLISMTGNLAMFVALPVAVYGRSGSAWATAVTAMAALVPRVLVTQGAGVLADRMDRRILLMSSNVAMAVLTVGYLAIPTDAWLPLAAVHLLVHSASQFAGPSEHALLSELVPPDRLGEGASLNAMNNNVARLLGPAVGGLLFAHAGFWITIVLNVATFLLAALLVLCVTRRRPFPPQHEAESAGWISRWWSGVRLVWTHPELRPLVLLVAITMFGEGAISALLAPFTSDMLGGGAPLLGAMLTGQAAGGIAGAWWASRVADRHPPLVLLGGAGIVSGCLLLVIFNYPMVYQAGWPAVAFSGLAGFPFAVFGAAQGYALQVYAPPQLRGRVYSLAMGLIGLAQLSGTAVAGIAAEQWGPLVINIDAGAYLIVGLMALRVARRLEGNRAIG